MARSARHLCKSLLFLISFVGDPLHSQTSIHAIDVQKTCIELVEEMEFYKRNHWIQGIKELNFWQIAPNPVLDFLDPLMANLDDFSYLRLRLPLVEALTETCKNPSRFGLSADVSLQQAFAHILSTYKLDTALPKWGLIDVPVFDIFEQTTNEIVLTWAELPLDVSTNPINDSLRVAVTEFLSDFEIETPEDFENARILLVTTTYLDRDQPFVNALNEAADQLGLRRRGK